MQSNDKIILSLIVCLVGLFLLQKPNCNRGCKTIAEHLLTDGLDEMIAAFFA